MPDLHPLIPPAQDVRERLSRSVRETIMLRSLLRLAVRADRDRGQVNSIGQPLPERRREPVAC